MKIIEIYTRCSGDCLFSTLRCPMDGWSTADTQLIYRTKMALRDSGVTVTLDCIKAELMGKVDARTLDSLVEITFSDPQFHSDCFVPRELVELEVRNVRKSG